MRKICIPVVRALLFVPLLAAPAPALAAVCAVPSSYATIQSALDDAGCATIQIAAGTFAENLYVYRSVTLQGAGAGQTILDGSNAGTVIYIQGIGPATAVNISGVTVQHGSASNGAGIANHDAAVNLTASRVANNTGYFQGGGIRHQGNGIMTIVDSTIADNTMPYNDGAGIRNYGGTMIIRNSTISGNSTSGWGGGIAHSGSLTIVNSTIAGNSGGWGGAIASDGHFAISASTLSGNSGAYPGRVIWNTGSSSSKNSVFDDVPASDNYGFYGGHGVSGVNFSSDPSVAGFTIVTPAQLNLGTLGAHGGSTATQVPGPGSVLIDAVTDCTAIGGAPVIADQRGVARPQGAACDAGAVEVAPPTPAEQVDSLALAVASVGLDAGSASALTSKLDAAAASLAKDNKNAASGQLGAFVNQVKALVKSGRLSSANGAALTAAANAILAGL